MRCFFIGKFVTEVFVLLQWKVFLRITCNNRKASCKVLQIQKFRKNYAWRSFQVCFSVNKCMNKTGGKKVAKCLMRFHFTLSQKLIAAHNCVRNHFINVFSLLHQWFYRFFTNASITLSACLSHNSPAQSVTGKSCNYHWNHIKELHTVNKYFCFFRFILNKAFPDSGTTTTESRVGERESLLKNGISPDVLLSMLRFHCSKRLQFYFTWRHFVFQVFSNKRTIQFIFQH